MFIHSTGDMVVYRRRVEGQDSLFVFVPDASGPEVHARLASSSGLIRAWPTLGGKLLVSREWPSRDGGLKIEVMDLARVREVMERTPDRLNETLQRPPSVTNFQPERRGLEVEIFEAIKGEHIVLPGLSPFTGKAETQSPALYELDGDSATYRVVPMSYLSEEEIPNNVYDEPGGRRRWITCGDSNHALVVHARGLEPEGEIIWPVEEQSLARLAFHPFEPEVWVCALTTVFVFDRSTLKLKDEISIDGDLRWHRGERTRGSIGGLCFSQDAERALVARPFSGDLIELDTRTRKPLRTIPMALDPLEVAFSVASGRAFVQGMRNGQISWLSWR